LERTENQVIAQDISPDEKMRLVCEAADETKAHDITVMDVRGQTIIADYFVICTGTSVTHIQSIADRVQEKLDAVVHTRGTPRAKPQGDAQSYWLILDYSDVILHIFSSETREFYDLERLWSDAKISHYGSAENGDGGETS
jgi:ribosome-associated protein